MDLQIIHVKLQKKVVDTQNIVAQDINRRSIEPQHFKGGGLIDW